MTASCSISSKVSSAVEEIPLSHQLGTKVEHFYLQPSKLPSEGALLVLDVISERINIPSDLIRRLIWFGAIYTSKVVPLPAASVEESLRVQILEWRHEGQQRHGRDTRLSHPQRVLDPRQTINVQEGAYFRIHLHPKRFPVAHSIRDWRSRVIYEAPEFVVVDKPPGIQVPPTVDNIRESLLAKIEEALDGTCSLTPPHRLDVGTSGLMVLSKSHRFSSWFQKKVLGNKSLDSLPRLTKTYRCLVANPPRDLGPLVHHLMLEQGVKGEPQHTICLDEPLLGQEGQEISHRSELVILSTRACQSEGHQAHEVEIRLVTGRTHQTRAQMAAIGSPLVGDVLYEVVARRRQSLKLRGQAGDDLNLKGLLMSSDDLRGMQDDPLKAFALQSFRLEITVDPGDKEGMQLMSNQTHMAFEAGAP